MKKPRFEIRDIEGDISVRLFDRDNCLVLRETMDEGQDPYLYISRLREMISEAEITEFPRLPQMLDETWRKGYAQILREQIGDMEKIVDGLREQVASLEKQENSFTDELN
jgi:hypothetical protein